MPMYAYQWTRRRTRVDEAGCDFRPVQGPNINTRNWSEVWLYYWAFQVDFLDEAGAETGGGHFGLQAYANPDLPDGFTSTVVNWGVYDSVIGGLTTFRSAQVLDNVTFADINSDVSFGYRWQYGHWYRFRVFKSPKQDWTAPEIRPADGQVPPYVGTDQQATEVAYRCTIQDLTAGTVPFDFHDVLIKNPAASKPMVTGVMWTEEVSLPGFDLQTTWTDSPICDFRAVDWDGSEMISQWQTTYSASSANNDVRFVSGSPGYIRMLGPVTRTNAQNTIVNTPTGFYDAAQPNVTPDIHDLSPRVATPRPHF